MPLTTGSRVEVKVGALAGKQGTVLVVGSDKKTTHYLIRFDGDIRMQSFKISNLKAI